MRMNSGRAYAGRAAASRRRSSGSANSPLTASAAIPARPSLSGTANAVHRRVDDVRAGGDHARDFRGRDVLALPAEGVADAVDEVEKSLRVLAHQIAGAVPGIARLEHVAQHLARAWPRGRCSPRSASRRWSSRIWPSASPASFGRAALAAAGRVAQRRLRARRRSAPAPRVRDARGTAECDRWRPTRPRSCRERNCPRSRRSTRGSAGYRSAAGTPPRHPRAGRCRRRGAAACAALSGLRRSC